MRANRDAEAAARVIARQDKSPSDMFGPVGIMKLLRLCQIQQEVELPQFWRDISAAPKSRHISILQMAIDREKLELGEKYLDFEATASIIASIKGLSWNMVSNDAVDTGLNIFQMIGQTSGLKGLSHKEAYEMLHGGGANPSIEDAAALLSAKPHAPKLIHHAREHVRRYEIIMRIILPPHHGLIMQLNRFSNQLTTMTSMLHILMLEHLLLPTMLCKKISVPVSNWCIDQANSPNQIPVPNLCSVFDKIIDEDSSWEPALTSQFLDKLGLTKDFARHRQAHPSDPVLPKTDKLITPPAPLDSSQRRVNNIHYNSKAFDTFRSSGTKSSRDIKNMIRLGELPELPKSKVNSQQMCLSWHVKGMCNENCRLATDHIRYADNEYKQLLDWCTANYPTK